MNPIKLPPIISAQTIRAIAPQGDTHAVRIILLNSIGATTYTLRGQGARKGKYMLEKSGESGRHQLDIPVSLWNLEMPSGRYHDNKSISHDLLSRPNPLAPFALQIVPIGSQAETPSGTLSVDLVDAIETLTLRLLLNALPDQFKAHATPEFTDLLNREIGPTITNFLDAAGRKNTVDFINLITAAPSGVETPAASENIPAAAPAKPKPAPKPAQSTSTRTETSAARRMREKRARDKAAREAAKVMQPA